MKEFLLVYRATPQYFSSSTAEETKARSEQWMHWLNSIADQNKLANKGSRLTTEGRVVRTNGMLTNGPYSEIKEMILGYSVVKAESYDEAVRLTTGCPILVAGCVEVREIYLQ